MAYSTFSQERWLTVRTHFLWDTLILFFGVIMASVLRFQDATPNTLYKYLPVVFVGGLVLSSLIYGSGMYSDRVHLPRRYRFLVIFLCYAGALMVMLGLGSIHFDARLGRGVLMMSIPLTCMLLFVHHGLIMKSSLGVRERLLVIVSDEKDEKVSGLLKRLNPPFMELVGILDTRNPASSGISQQETLAGDLSELTNLIEKLGIQSVLCTTSQLRDPQIGENLRKASFSGARLVTLADVMEESFRLVPINLVTPEWLLMASTLPQRSYVRKWKRLFDVFVSLFVGLFALPILLLGMLWVKIASPEGPVFFRQVRRGRLGRPFDVVKLRTMKVDAESNGPQWAKKHDSRVFLGGRWLRKFRIDEIPQLINILKGEMSFVGPRPERPEFADQLASEIPYFRERLLVAPGLTGWAQVRYPYGASVDDAIRKLEYDLYYMKHMTITMDLFILLDTARIVLGGGVSTNKRTESCMKEFLLSHSGSNNSLVQLANVELA